MHQNHTRRALFAQPLARANVLVSYLLGLTMAEHMTPVVAKVLPEEKAAFAAATQQVGTTPSNAIRMFIAAFNRCGTFPFDISPAGVLGAPHASVQPLASDGE